MGAASYCPTARTVYYADFRLLCCLYCSQGPVAVELQLVQGVAAKAQARCSPKWPPTLIRS